MKTLLLSMREVTSLAGQVSLYEGEDVFNDLLGAHVVNPTLEAFSSCEKARKVHRTARRFHLPRLAEQAIQALLFQPVNGACLGQDYDLFLPVFNNPSELFTLNYIDNWKLRSRVSVCYIHEFWPYHLKDNFAYMLELLKGFDHIFVGMQSCVEDINRITGQPCSFLPVGVDTLRFVPRFAPAHPSRDVAICNIGRRSEITHKALYEAAKRSDEHFYWYDTFSVPMGAKQEKGGAFFVKNPEEHRQFLASVLKRSQYFIVNCAMADDPERRGFSEMPARLFEGAAAGTVMLGNAHEARSFSRYFGWEDAVIPMPFDAPQVNELIAQLNQDPQRIETIRRNNMGRSLLQHDWLYRLKAIFESVNLPPTDQMLKREEKLQAFAQRLLQQDGPPPVQAKPLQMVSSPVQA